MSRGRGRGGRSRGRSQGRGRGRGRGTAPSKAWKGTEAKQKRSTNLQDPINYFSIGTSPAHLSEQIHITEVVLDHILKKLKNSEDLVRALEDQEEIDFDQTKPQPLQLRAKRPAVTDSTGQVIKAAETDEEYKNDTHVDREIKDREVDVWFKKKLNYDTNKPQVYAIIMGQCTDDLKEKIKTQPDFESGIKGNPIKLMKAIKQLSMSHQKEKTYDMSMMRDVLRNLLNCHQTEGETVSKYAQRMRASKDILETYLGGPIEFKEIVKNDKSLSPDDKTYKALWSRFCGFMLLANSSKPRFGSLVQDMKNDFVSTGKHRYPDSIEDAVYILEEYRNPYQKEGDPKIDKDPGKPDDQKRGMTDAEKTEMLRQQEVPAHLTLAQMEGRCYICGRKNHFANKCPDREKHPDSSTWAINKAGSQHMQNATASTVSSRDEDTIASGSGWAPLQMFQQFVANDAKTASSAGVFKQRSDRPNLSDITCLDSASTINSACNPKYVENVKKATCPLTMVSNTGRKTIDQRGNMPLSDEVWYDEEGATNILSLYLMTKRFRVTMDSAKDNAFIVHLTNGKTIRFPPNEDGLYHVDMTRFEQHISRPKASEETNAASQHTQTVEENAAFYTPQQRARARKARDLLHSVGYPTVNDLKTAIKMNAIQDNPVTTEDVNIAEQIYGPDVSSIKGKTTRSRPHQVREDVIEIPPELLVRQQHVDLCVDIMFVNEKPYLSSISKRLMYRTCQDLPSRSVKSVVAAMHAIFHIYDRGGFHIRCIHGDQEFQPVVDAIVRAGKLVDSNIAAANEKVGEAERNNRTIKECVRATFLSAPFQALPNKITTRVVSESARKLNYFPPRGGVSATYSPRELVTGKRLSYSKECLVPILSYVQSEEDNEKKNDNRPRALDCIYLRPMGNAQGGHELYNLATGEVINRKKCTPVPITPSVITAVEQAAKAEGQRGYKIRSKEGVIFYDSSLTAGVDYTDYQNDDDPYNDPDYEYESDEDEDLPDLDDDYESGSDDEEDKEPRRSSVEEEQEDDEQEEQEASNVDEAEESEDEQSEDEEAKTTGVRRTSRTAKPTEKMKAWKLSQGTSLHQDEETPFKGELTYDDISARVLAMIMTQIMERGSETVKRHGQQFVVTYSLKKAIAKFGKAAKESARKEMRQMVDRDCFTPIRWSDLTPTERKRALESLLFIVQKGDGSLKSRHCANGKPQREWMGREDVSSPTVSTESTMITSIIDALEKRFVATCDIPNAFIQTILKGHDKVGERTIMKIRGPLVDILVEMRPDYKEFVVMEKGQKVLYVHVTKAIYGLLVSAMLFYEKLRADLEKDGFIVNPYDPCVANKIVKGKQLTVSWHVDDLKVSHVNKEVVHDFLEWVKEKYGKIGEVKVNTSKVHEYLGMKIDFTRAGKVSIDMREYVDVMDKDFPKEELKQFNVKSPWTAKLFVVDEDSPSLSEEKKDQFHHTTAQGLFLCKRGRPDISPAIAYFCTRVNNPNEDDWQKLVRMMKYLKRTRNDVLTLEGSDDLRATWYVDASFAVHPDFRSHTGVMMTLGKGAAVTMSRKQGINTRSSTEAELVGADDAIGPILWSRLFLHHQGYEQENVLMQDNQSAMKMETNGRSSAGKRSRHINIRYFFVADMVKKKYLSLEYCPTDKMFADYMTKPLHGQKFNEQRDVIMNLTPSVAAQMVMVACFRCSS